MKRFRLPEGIPCLVIIGLIFGYIGSIMGLPNMLNTIMKQPTTCCLTRSST